MSTAAIDSESLSAYGDARSTVEGAPLSPDELRRTDDYWRATLYLCLGMIYLKDNPLLREPLALDQLKTRLLGHRGSDPDGMHQATAATLEHFVGARLRGIGGRTPHFGHGHFFRVLAARWIGLPPGDARHLLLNTASLSIPTYEHSLDVPALRLWNDDRHVRP